jgi:hypothetical protein
MGENLKVVEAEFSTLNLVILLGNLSLGFIQLA